MRKRLTILLNALLLAMMFGFSACEGDQGEIGPAGADGAKGDKGTQGAPGDKGDASTEALTFGGIETTITGTSPEGEPYTASLDFNYLTQNDLGNSSYYLDDDGDMTFYISREYKNMLTNGRTNPESSNYIDFNFFVTEGIVELNNFYMSTNIIHDNKFFSISHYYYQYNEGAVAPVVTNYNFDATTGRLTFDFTLDYVDYMEEEVSLTDTVDIIVLRNFHD